ncbi:MAG: hypothetical protein KGL39_50335 [Patescibacteria group bacterium]|nr:hypothetical protein [Patescibacteria group bacterium]
MKKLLVAAIVALSLGACAQIQTAYDAVSGAKVSPTAVIVAGNSFDALEATATNYLRLKKCNGSNGPVCRDPKATAIIIPAVRSGRVARTNLEQFMKDHPGELGPQGLYDSLKVSIDTLRQAFSQYNIN